MRGSWLSYSLRFVGVLLASLLITIPIDFYRQGREGLLIRSFPIVVPFLIQLCLEPFRHTGRLQRFFEGRSFNGMLFRSFIIALPYSATNIVNAIWPTLYTAGLQFGLLIGLIAPVPYATLNHPETGNKSYW